MASGPTKDPLAGCAMPVSLPAVVPCAWFLALSLFVCISPLQIPLTFRGHSAIFPWVVDVPVAATCPCLCGSLFPQAPRAGGSRQACVPVSPSQRPASPEWWHKAAVPNEPPLVLPYCSAWAGSFEQISVTCVDLSTFSVNGPFPCIFPLQCLLPVSQKSFN